MTKIKLEIAIWRLALKRAWPQIKAVWFKDRKLVNGESVY